MVHTPAIYGVPFYIYICFSILSLLASNVIHCCLGHVPISVSNNKNDDEEDSVDETEFYAWNEMRLHPLLMKSIYRLNFKEPTPIQRACIPAAAHQGKVVPVMRMGFVVTMCSLPIY